MPSSPRPTENLTLERKSHSSPKDSSPLTSSALSFLKSRSKLLATVACLGASPGTKVSKPSLLWKELRGRKEIPLTAEQVAQECDHLLEQFPMLKSSLLAAWEPLHRPSEEGKNLASSLCGQASLSTVLLGLHSPIALDVLTKAFEEALVTRDWLRALQLTEVYGRDADDLSGIRDAVLSCAVACGKRNLGLSLSPVAIIFTKHIITFNLHNDSREKYHHNLILLREDQGSERLENLPGWQMVDLRLESKFILL